MPILRSFLAWLVILMLAIANGAVREVALVPSLGRIGSCVLSGLVLASLVALVAYVFVGSRPNITVSQGVHIGVFWLFLTLAFEFGFGLYVQHRSWADLLDAYTFKGGNLWPVVLVVTLCAPAVAAWAKSKHA
jgi:hypothetical protein